jgi:hypothetical protein
MRLSPTKSWLGTLTLDSFTPPSGARPSAPLENVRLPASCGRGPHAADISRFAAKWPEAFTTQARTGLEDRQLHAVEADVAVGANPRKHSASVPTADAGRCGGCVHRQHGLPPSRSTAASRFHALRLIRPQIVAHGRSERRQSCGLGRRYRSWIVCAVRGGRRYVDGHRRSPFLKTGRWLGMALLCHRAPRCRTRMKCIGLRRHRAGVLHSPECRSRRVIVFEHEPSSPRATMWSGSAPSASDGVARKGSRRRYRAERWLVSPYIDPFPFCTRDRRPIGAAARPD